MDGAGLQRAGSRLEVVLEVVFSARGRRARKKQFVVVRWGMLCGWKLAVLVLLEPGITTVKSTEHLFPGEVICLECARAPLRRSVPAQKNRPSGAAIDLHGEGVNAHGSCHKWKRVEHIRATAHADNSIIGPEAGVLIRGRRKGVHSESRKLADLSRCAQRREHFHRHRGMHFIPGIMS